MCIEMIKLTHELEKTWMGDESSLVEPAIPIFDCVVSSALVSVDTECSWFDFSNPVVQVVSVKKFYLVLDQ